MSAAEEIAELVMEAVNEARRCANCAKCRAVCPLYLATREDHMSPRALVWLLYTMEKTGRVEVLRHVLRLVSLCTLCYACQVRCPPGVRIVDRIILPLRRAIELLEPTLRQLLKYSNSSTG